MDYRVFLFFGLVSGAVSQSSWKSTSRPDAGPCEQAFNTTVLNSLGDISLESIIIESIDVMSYSRGQLNDWVFRVCRNIDNMASRLNDSCSDRTVNHSDIEEHASFQKSAGITAVHQYLCSNAGSNLKDLVLGNGPQCVQDIERYWRDCPETPSRTAKPTQVILTTYRFSPDVCSFLVSTESCYMNAFGKSNICAGNSRQHFQTFIGILLEKAGCSDRNVFGKPVPIGFSDVPSFNFKVDTNTNPNQFTSGRLPGFGPQPQGGPFSSGSNQFPSGSNQFPSGSNQFPSGSNQFPSGSNQFPSASNQFPSGSNQYPANSGPGSNQFSSSSNQFPSSSNQFPSGSNQFPSTSQFQGSNNQGFNGGNQFGAQNNQPVTPRIFNSSANFNQFQDPYSRPFGTSTGFNSNQQNQQYPYDQRPYNPNYPVGNGFQGRDQFAFASQNSNQNPFDRLDPSSGGPRTTLRPGFDTDRNFDRYNRSQSGVYMSQGSTYGSGSDDLRMHVSSLILTLFCSYLLQ